MKVKSLSRRTFIKSMGGAIVGLPVLEIMLNSHGTALASGALPTRFAIFFDGQSLGSDADPTREYFTPTTTGPGYALTEALKPLGAHGVKGDVSVVSGLTIPVDSGLASRRADFHSASHYPMINGMSTHAGGSSLGAGAGMGAGVDQLVAEAIGASSRIKTLNYQAQAYWYLDTAEFAGRDILTFKKDSRGSIVPVVNQTSPQAAFRALFNLFTPSSGADAAALAKRKSILDLVSGDVQSLIKLLGASDQLRMERHLDEIRDLERRIDEANLTAAGSCTALADPGADPVTAVRYSDEAKRARIFCDLIHMAFVCDISRAATLMITAPQSHMMIQSVFPDITMDIHEIGHSGNNAFPDGKGASFAMARVIGWHVDFYAYLISKLKATPEGAGNVLDNSALLFMTEGGQGKIYGEAGKTVGTHSTDNMALLLAGRAGGLVPGSHFRLPGEHPTRVVISAMNAVGLSGGLGELTGNIPALFGR